MINVRLFDERTSIFIVFSSSFVELIGSFGGRTTPPPFRGGVLFATTQVPAFTKITIDIIVGLEYA